MKKKKRCGCAERREWMRKHAEKLARSGAQVLDELRRILGKNP